MWPGTPKMSSCKWWWWKSIFGGDIFQMVNFPKVELIVELNLNGFVFSDSESSPSLLKSSVSRWFLHVTRWKYLLVWTWTLAIFLLINWKFQTLSGDLCTNLFQDGPFILCLLSILLTTSYSEENGWRES